MLFCKCSYNLRCRHAFTMIELLHYHGVGLDGRHCMTTPVMMEHPTVCMPNTHMPAASHFSLTTSLRSTLPQQPHPQRRMPMTPPAPLLLSCSAPRVLGTQAGPGNCKRTRMLQADLMEVLTPARSGGAGVHALTQQ